MHHQPVTVVALLIQSQFRVIRERRALLIEPQVSSISFSFVLGRGLEKETANHPVKARELWRWRSKAHTTLTVVCGGEGSPTCAERTLAWMSLTIYFIPLCQTRHRFTVLTLSQGHMTPSCLFVLFFPRKAPKTHADWSETQKKGLRSFCLSDQNILKF